MKNRIKYLQILLIGNSLARIYLGVFCFFVLFARMIKDKDGINEKIAY